MKQRFEFIDITKGIGIILVTIGHNYYITNDYKSLFILIYSFHMPLFFFLSGIVFKQQKTMVVLILKKTDSIIKPYLFSFVSLIPLVLLMKQSTLSNLITAFIYGTGRVLPPIMIPLWFLPLLFFVHIYSAVFLRFVAKASKKIIWNVVFFIINLFAGYFLLHLINQKFDLFSVSGFPWNIDLVLLTSTFFIAGCYFSQEIRKESSKYFKNPKHIYIIFLIALTGFSVIHLIYDYTIDLNLRRYDSPFLTTLQAFLGIFLVLSFSKILEKIRLLKYLLSFIGKKSLVILVFHSFFQIKILYSLLDMFILHPLIIFITSVTASVFFPIFIDYLVIGRIHFIKNLFYPIKTKKISEGLNK